MNGSFTEELGIEFPVFAFSHCRDVVAAVSAAGGMGVLGASPFTPDEIAVELRWIEDHCNGAPYGVDFAFPRGTVSDALSAYEHRDVPQQHKRFVADLLERYEVPPIESEVEERATYRGVDFGSYDDALDIVFEHPNARVIAAALGSPPQHVVDRAHADGRVIAALCGSPRQALRNKEAGADIIVCQGTEAGGHTGEISTMVLVPQVVDLVAPTPVLAAGGIGNGRQMAAAMALGAAGVWTGSVWLTTEESDLSDEMVQKLINASSEGTVRSLSLTGKPCRVVRTAWTEEWDATDAPSPLPMPLQGMLVEDALKRIERAARRDQSRGVELLTCPAGQVIGQSASVRRSQRVLLEMVTEYIDTVEALRRRTGVD